MSSPAEGDRWRVYRDTEHAWIAGVCAGIADNLGIDPALVRIAAVISLVFFVVPTVVAYIACALILKPKPATLFADSEEEAFWRDLRADPAQSLDAVRGSLRRIDRRLARMEGLVASEEFDLRRGFRDLGG